LSYEAFNLGVNVTTNNGDDNDDALFDAGDVYTYASAGFPLAETYSLNLTAGFYAFTNDGDESIGGADADYFHLAAGIEKDVGDFGSVSFNAEFADIDEEDALGSVNSDDVRFWVGWSKGF